jgi:multidrug efflux pump subunit AcrB
VSTKAAGLQEAERRRCEKDHCLLCGPLVGRQLDHGRRDRGRGAGDERLSSSLVPREQKRYVEVYADLPGASAIDVERFVTFRLEEALSGMENVEQIRSSTRNGGTHVRVKVKAHVESPTATMEEVRSRLSAIRHLLPKDMRPLRIKEQKRRNAEWLLNVLIERVDKKDPKHRAAIAALAERLRRVPNVIHVRNNMPKLDLFVRFSRSKMAAASLDVTIARRRLLEFLGQMPVGSIRVRDQEVSIELSRPFNKLSDLEELPLRLNRMGEGVTLGDVATVRLDFRPRAVRWRLNGREDYVELAVVNSEESDSITISQKVRSILKKDGSKILAKPLTWRVGQDASGLIAHELETLTDNGLGCVVIVLVVLMIFLGWRISLMTAIGLPFAYMGIVLVLPLFGVTFNIISLVGMILVVGILVDDAIIVSEEYSQRLSAGMSGRAAAIEAVSRIAKPVMGMVATTSVAFLPAIVLKGDATWLLRPLPIVIISALERFVAQKQLEAYRAVLKEKGRIFYRTAADYKKKMVTRLDLLAAQSDWLAARPRLPVFVAGVARADAALRFYHPSAGK